MGRGASRGRNGTATALVRRVKPNTDTQEIQGALATQQEIHKQVIQWGDLIPPLLMSKIDQFEAIVCGDSNFGLMDFKILAADIKRAVCELQMNSQASDLQAEELAQNGDAEESYAVSLVEEVDIPLHSIASASNTSHNDVSGDPQISYATLPTLEAEDDDFAGVVVSPNEEMQYITKLKIAEVKSRKQFIEQKIEGLYESERESMQYFRDISHHITGMKKLIGALSSSSTKKEELTRQKLKLEEESKNIESKINDSTKHHEELEDEAKCLAIQISALEHVSAKEAYESSHRTYIDCAKHYVEIYKQKQSSLMKQKERHEFQLKKNLSLALMQADIDLAREQKLYNEQFYVELVQLQQGLSKSDDFMLFDAKRRELNKEKREVLENLQLKYDNAATAAEQSNRDDLEKLESDISHAVEQNEQAFAREMAKIWTPVSDALTLLKKAASAIDGTIVEELPQYNLVDESVSNEFALHDVGDMLDVTVELTGVE